MSEERVRGEGWRRRGVRAFRYLLAILLLVSCRSPQDLGVDCDLLIQPGLGHLVASEWTHDAARQIVADVFALPDKAIAQTTLSETQHNFDVRWERDGVSYYGSVENQEVVSLSAHLKEYRPTYTLEEIKSCLGSPDSFGRHINLHSHDVLILLNYHEEGLAVSTSIPREANLHDPQLSFEIVSVERMDPTSFTADVNGYIVESRGALYGYFPWPSALR